eukprot:SAG11_NODE_30125_length_304_cov_0.541463_1_plen_47_part_01
MFGGQTTDSRDFTYESQAAENSCARISITLAVEVKHSSEQQARGNRK